MGKCVLFIDGENFLHKLEEVLKESLQNKGILHTVNVDFDKLFNKVLQDLKPSKKIFYAARIHLHPDTKEKSEELIKIQRKLRNKLIKQGFEFIIAGNVRAQKVGQKVIFREKGVDVKMGVDMVSMACRQHLETVILCSSDSDLQPAVKELRNRNIEVVYLGFGINPNKGLAYTTNRIILIRNSEVIEAYNNLIKS